VNLIFGRPEAWPLCILALALGLGLRFLDRGRAAALEAALAGLLPRLCTDADLRARRARIPILALAFLALALAAMEPSMPGFGGGVRASGQDLVLVLDVSRSMLARDAMPSRLEAAKSEILKLARAARGDRVGVVIFAGEARRLLPLTRDQVSLEALIADADPASVMAGGSDLGEALLLAAGLGDPESGEPPVVVVLSDGEDLAGRGVAAAQVLAAQGITVHAISFGSEAGARIPIPGPEGEHFLEDGSGGLVLTRRDGATLRALAHAAGGVVLDAETRTDPLLALHEEVVRPRAARRAAELRARSEGSLYQWPLLLAVLLLCLEVAWSDRRRP
jgi:Ca-activated chloride channel family protein